MAGGREGVGELGRSVDVAVGWEGVGELGRSIDVAGGWEGVDVDAMIDVDSTTDRADVAVAERGGTMVGDMLDVQVADTAIGVR